MELQIYFAVHTDRIKIGISRDIFARLKNIGAHLAGEVQLLGTILGSHPFERAIHKRLASFKLRGEWYRDCEEVRQTILLLQRHGASAIGFKPFAPDSVAHADRSAGADRISFGQLVKLAWPRKAAYILSERTGADLSTAKRWMSGRSRAPASAVYKVLGDIFARLE